MTKSCHSISMEPSSLQWNRSMVKPEHNYLYCFKYLLTCFFGNSQMTEHHVPLPASSLYPHLYTALLDNTTSCWLKKIKINQALLHPVKFARIKSNPHMGDTYKDIGSPDILQNNVFQYILSGYGFLVGCLVSSTSTIYLLCDTVRNPVSYSWIRTLLIMPPVMCTQSQPIPSLDIPLHYVRFHVSGQIVQYDISKPVETDTQLRLTQSQPEYPA